MGASNTKDESFHVLELHQPTVAMAIVSMVALIALVISVACLVKKFSRRQHQAATSDPEAQVLHPVAAYSHYTGQPVAHPAHMPSAQFHNPYPLPQPVQPPPATIRLDARAMRTFARQFRDAAAPAAPAPAPAPIARVYPTLSARFAAQNRRAQEEEEMDQGSDNEYEDAQSQARFQNRRDMFEQMPHFSG